MQQNIPNLKIARICSHYSRKEQVHQKSLHKILKRFDNYKKLNLPDQLLKKDKVSEKLERYLHGECFGDIAYAEGISKSMQKEITVHYNSKVREVKEIEEEINMGRDMPLPEKAYAIKEDMHKTLEKYEKSLKKSEKFENSYAHFLSKLMLHNAMEKMPHRVVSRLAGVCSLAAISGILNGIVLTGLIFGVAIPAKDFMLLVGGTALANTATVVFGTFLKKDLIALKEIVDGAYRIIEREMKKL